MSQWRMSNRTRNATRNSSRVRSKEARVVKAAKARKTGPVSLGSSIRAARVVKAASRAARTSRARAASRVAPAGNAIN